MLQVDTLGIGNGCVDVKVMAASYPQMAFNNTYGIQLYDERLYKAVMKNVTAPGIGCHDLSEKCRALAKEGDPTGQGTNKTVNAACLEATQVCFGYVQGTYSATTQVRLFASTIPSFLHQSIQSSFCVKAENAFPIDY